jgi:DNA modification methylase
MQDIIISNEFKELIPPLSDDEFSQLESNCLSEGIRDPLILWDETLVDGHNRYAISQKHGIGFKTKQLLFDDIDQAKVWIINNQLGRRNINDYCRLSLVKAKEEIVKAEAKERQLSGLKQFEDNDTVKQNSAERRYENQTRAILAKEAGVSHDTYDKFKKIEEGATPELKEKLKQSEVSINAAYSIATLPPEKQKEIIENADPKAIKAVAKKIRSEEANEKKEKLAQKKKEKEAQLIAELKCKPKIYNEPLRQFGDGFFDLLLTDPPYSTEVDDIHTFAKEWLEKAIPMVKKTGRVYICIGAYPRELAAYFSILDYYHSDWIIDPPLIWTYRNTLGVTPKMKYNLNYQVILHLYTEQSSPLNKDVTNEMFSVQDINAPDGRHGDRYYKWQKPDELARRLITHSTKEGDKILDPFTGSGTFILMANKLKRDGYGFEIDDNALEIAKQRGCEHV